MLLLKSGFWITLWVLGGCAVLATVDDKEQRLFKWFDTAPNEVFKVIVLVLWPIAAVLMVMARRNR